MASTAEAVINAITTRDGYVATPSRAALEVIFPVGATVQTIVRSVRKPRNGSTIAHVVVLAVVSDKVTNVSAMVANVTGDRVASNAAPGNVDSPAVIVTGHGVSIGAALVAELARELYGSSTALGHAGI